MRITACSVVRRIFSTSARGWRDIFDARRADLERARGAPFPRVRPRREPDGGQGGPAPDGGDVVRRRPPELGGARCPVRSQPSSRRKCPAVPLQLCPVVRTGPACGHGGRWPVAPSWVDLGRISAPSDIAPRRRVCERQVASGIYAVRMGNLAVVVIPDEIVFSGRCRERGQHGYDQSGHGGLSRPRKSQDARMLDATS